MNKRKCSLEERGGEFSMDPYTKRRYDSDDSITTGPSEDGSVKKQNHSAIEKKRREKMNTYIQELSRMIPTCNAMTTKLDKLTILRMAVQHIKTIRGCPSSYKEANYKPPFLSEDELKSLILKSAEGFLLVISCDRGRMLYVSESVSSILSVSREGETGQIQLLWLVMHGCTSVMASIAISLGFQEYLIGQSLFDILHPKDMSKVKEQLSSSDLTPRERFIDTKTGLPVESEVVHNVSQLSSGNRRLFFCRLRQYSNNTVVKTEEQNQHPNIKKKHKYMPDQKKYVAIQCTGYLKSWPLSQLSMERDNERDNSQEGVNLSCLIAVAKPIPDAHQLAKQSDFEDESLFQFVTRQAMDGKFTFIDQKATSILGYLPQELLGTSCYEYIHVGDIKHMAEYHYAVLLKNERLETQIYRFRAKNGAFLRLKSKLFCLRNPWTKDVEYIVSTNTVVNIQGDGGSRSGEEPSGAAVDNILEDIGVPSELRDVPGVPCNLHPAASQIGWKIAEEALEKQLNAPLENSPLGVDLEEPDTSSESMSVTSPPLQAMPSNSLNTGDDRQPDPHESITTSDIAGSIQDVPPTIPVEKPGSSTHDESSMAFIMNLLEADAGLGGVVDFTGLPWPLLNG